MYSRYFTFCELLKSSFDRKGMQFHSDSRFYILQRKLISLNYSDMYLVGATLLSCAI